MEQIIAQFGIIIVTLLYVCALYFLSKADSPEEMFEKFKARDEENKSRKFVA